MSGILAISDANGTDPNLFDIYDQLRASDIKMHATINVDADTRQMQSNDKICHCLNNSLNTSVTAKIIAKSTSYYIGINHCGAILFKLIPQNSIIDTGAKASNVRENISRRTI